MPTRQSCIKAAACGQALPGYRQRQSRYPLRAGRKSAAPDRHRTTRPHTELTSSRVPRQVLGAAAKPKQFLESIFRPEVDQNTQPCAITATQGRIACVCMAPPPVLGEAPHFLEHGCATYASQENTGILRWAWPTRTRYPSKHATVSHPHTCAGLTEAQLALRKDQSSRSLLAEGGRRNRRR